MKNKLLALLVIGACCYACTDEPGVEETNENPGSFSASVSDITKTSANINWSAATDSDGDEVTYELQLGDDIVDSELTSTSYQLSSLIEDTNYSGKIIASDGNGGSSEASFSFVTNGNQNPSTFTAEVIEIGTSSAVLQWTAATDSDGDDITYTVYLDGQAVGESLSNLSYNFTELMAETQYSGTIEASDGNGGMSSTSYSFTTISAENNDPGTFTVTVDNVTESTALLNWTASVDPDGDEVTYVIRLAGNVVAEGVSETSYSLESLTASTTYNGRVIAEDGKGGSIESTFSFETGAGSSTTEYTLDPSLFNSDNFTVEAKLVDCTLENGSSTKCYELTFISNGVPDDGPFCPATVDDIGGMGIYDGQTNAGFQVMKRELFEAMENDGYDIIDDQGNIRVSDFSTQDNPNFDYCLQPAVNDNLVLKFTIPAIPEDLSSPNQIESVELIGVSLDGVPMNGDPPSVTTGQMGNGNIPSLDPCGGHHDPSGYYHWHFIPQSVNEVLNAFQITEISCTNITQDGSALSGFAKDGYPIYAYTDSDGSLPSDLDNCNGHFAATDEYPDGVYHYHASQTEAPNMPPCIKGAAVSNPFVVQ